MKWIPGPWVFWDIGTIQDTPVSGVELKYIQNTFAPKNVRKKPKTLRSLKVIVIMLRFLIWNFFRKRNPSISWGLKNPNPLEKGDIVLFRMGGVGVKTWKDIYLGHVHAALFYERKGNNYFFQSCLIRGGKCQREIHRFNAENSNRSNVVVIRLHGYNKVKEEAIRVGRTLMENTTLEHVDFTTSNIHELITGSCFDFQRASTLTYLRDAQQNISTRRFYCITFVLLCYQIAAQNLNLLDDTTFHFNVPKCSPYKVLDFPHSVSSNWNVFRLEQFFEGQITLPDSDK